jgi:hypothetical protein
MRAHDGNLGAFAMSDKLASGNSKTAKKSARTASKKLPTKKPRLSKLEAERLEGFKSLMKEYGGKGLFARYDE